MADTDIQTETNKAAEVGRKATEAVASSAQAAVQGEQRSFAAAGDATRDATRRTAELWRNFMAPLNPFQSEVGRWYEQMWRQMSPVRGPGMFLAALPGQPVADLRETDQGLELCVELPGLKADDIRLSLRGDALVVSGERAEETNGHHGGYHFSERRFGHFERSFPLPAGADRSRIDASYQDGLLRVAIPVGPEGAEETAIPVKS